jgi:hypothetical protein
MTKRSIATSIIASGLMGAAVGLPVLGLMGRGIMRIIAHWEGRIPAFTIGGTLTVVFVATLAGLAAGLVYGVLKRLIANGYIRNAVFLAMCVAFTWRALNTLLPRPRLMFVALTVVYVLVLEIVTAMRERSSKGKSEVNPAFAG